MMDPYASAGELLAALKANKTTSVALVEALRARIEEFKLDQRSCKTRAVVFTDFPSALERAAEADAARKKGESWGPLHGLPMTVKEEIAVKGWLITKGMSRFADCVAPENALCIQRLVDAGAILVGSTNTPVRCLDWQTFNDLFGRTRNPYDTAYSSGGSSGGSCVALAAGITPLEVGGDLAGSIRVPANFCGLVGVQPTYEKVPRQPWSTTEVPANLPPSINPTPNPLATYGPIARTAADARLLLEILAGTSCEKEGDPLAQPSAQLRDFSVAVWSDHKQFRVSKEVKRAVDIVAAALGNQSGNDEASGTVVKNLTCLSHDGIPCPTSSLDTYQAYRAFVAGKGDREENAAKQREYFPQAAKFFKTVDVLIAPVFATASFPADDEDETKDATTPGRKAKHTWLMDPTTGAPIESDYADYYFWPHFSIYGRLPATAFPVSFPSAAQQMGSQDKKDVKCDTQHPIPLGVQVIGPTGCDFRTLRFAELLMERLGTAQYQAPMQFQPARHNA